MAHVVDHVAAAGNHVPLSIVAVAIVGWWGLGLGAAAALLLAAALAPTDPVLASEVQVSEPLTEEGSDDDEARFAVTSEAGLNDGLAFPFTYAAIAVSMAGLAPSGWLGEWLLIDVVWRIGIGLVAGLAVGWALRRMFFSSISERLGFADRADGFIALGATFLAYGVAEVAEGYGFIAVFVCACTIRAGEHAHGLHSVLHTFVEQIERLLTVVVLILLSGAVARGLLESITVPDVLFAAVLLLVIRPVTGWLGLTPGKTGPRERGVIAVFGVRGVGSLFYIAYALQNGEFPGAERLWAVVSLVILGSVLIHGVAATPAMAVLDRTRRRRAAERGDGEVETPV
ncbi:MULTISPECIES: cation:proton antiporter [unclassified Microbacterium]|uniref:cation:proton antiporter domain-containing protein n=1 Tax=unclassified Microbacterium TaxID=2609290 RepID=UPI000A93529D|nr:MULTISPECIES: cation:proton antiporter [unclassified Microbacterium]